jgi:hypothetical protein
MLVKHVINLLFSRLEDLAMSLLEAFGLLLASPCIFPALVIKMVVNQYIS